MNTAKRFPCFFLSLAILEVKWRFRPSCTEHCLPAFPHILVSLPPSPSPARAMSGRYLRLNFSLLLFPLCTLRSLLPLPLPPVPHFSFHSSSSPLFFSYLPWPSTTSQFNEWTISQQGAPAWVLWRCPSPAHPPPPRLASRPSQPLAFTPFYSCLSACPSASRPLPWPGVRGRWRRMIKRRGRGNEEEEKQ